MVKIIPAIIAENFEDLKNKVKLIESSASLDPNRDNPAVQLDIMDGIFVPNETWRIPEDLKRLETGISFEAHLMVEWSQEIYERWLISKVKRIIWHWEALEKIINSSDSPEGERISIFDLAGKTHMMKKEFGIALNPDTLIEQISNYVQVLDLVLVMSVDPGFAGQKFQDKVIPKITALRRKYPDVKIEVDGGINIGNAKTVVQAGADILVAGSAIFGSDDIGGAINNLKESLI